MTNSSNPNPLGDAITPSSQPSKRGRVILFAAALLVVALLVIIPMILLSRHTSIRVLGEHTSNIEALKWLSQQPPPSRIHPVFDMAKYDDFVKKINLDLAGGAGTYDVILQYPMCLSSYTRNGYIVPVAEYDRYYKSPNDPGPSLFKAPWLETSYYRNDQQGQPVAYGYPFAANTMLLCYNKRLFNDPAHQTAFAAKYPNFKLEPPKDWDSFRAIAEYFSGCPGISGLCMQGQDGGWLYWEWCNYAFSMGGGVMNKQYGWEWGPSIPLMVSSKATIDATNYWLSLKPYNNSGLDFFQTGLDQQLANLRKGKTAMGIVWSDVAYRLVYGDPGTASLENMLGFAPIPGGKSMLAGGFFVVSAQSRKKADAIAYVLTVLEPDNQEKLAAKGLCSPVESVYSRPDVTRLPYADALHKSLLRGRYMIEAGPECEEVSTIMTKFLQRIWRGDLTVEKGLQDAEVEVDSARAAIYADLANSHP